ncbi:Ubiquitin carboxyl-terminal hydrolase family protein [Quillaja saponaria]|uniref:Ubiquitin carboxyl-terminal hydrolase family protein n=1 Tax=Quillaja saponaria TaxID=32244 RepID=A0AAD7VD48_QUISA|nr:Ubiquitin carboxyl-terminal hydrolase family protein [Quillaja saponaria]KAJ7971380.1 Ubiquitin carboxyl-terminal hydrolase family protein [Quillaja saponaria]
MENQEGNKVIPYEKFIWTKKKFSKSKSKKFSSKVFKIGGYSWKILVSPKGFGQVEDHLSLYLKLEDSVISPYRHVSFFAYFRLAVINQLDSNMSILKEAQKQFSPRNSGWGSQCFMPLTDFLDPSKGYLVNDRCIIEAEIFIAKTGPIENIQVHRETSKVVKSTIGSMETETTKKRDQEQGHNSKFEKSHVDHWPGYPSISADEFKDFSGLIQREKSQTDFDSFKDVPSTPSKDLIDFRGLCKVERALVPLLEEVCSWYPSLIACQQKRSPKFIGWAFTALGRVLYFLKTTKIKDMKEVEVCKNLQVLWEELETFKFDLTWLEPHVRSALDTRAYLEKVGQVRELRDDVVSFEMEVKRLKAKMAVIEVDLEIARRDLAKAEDGFKERDLEIEIGYDNGRSNCNCIDLCAYILCFFLICVIIKLYIF